LKSLEAVRASHSECAAVQLNLVKQHKAAVAEKEALQKSLSGQIKSLQDGNVCCCVWLCCPALTSLFTCVCRPQPQPRTAENAAWKVELATKLTYRSFRLQDTALFVRSEHGFYEALHRNAPHHYLALQQRSAYESLGDKILGRIFLIEKDTATAVCTRLTTVAFFLVFFLF
jgi:hypothetical protein